MITIEREEYEKVAAAGRGAKAILYSDEMKFFRDYIKMQQEEILKRFACDMLSETTSEEIYYDQSGKISGKRTEKTTKETREKAAKRSYQTLIDINDYLAACSAQAEALEHKIKNKEINFKDSEPLDDEEVEYVN